MSAQMKPLKPADSVRCVWAGDVQWTFWCIYCRVWHLHGAVPGHRSAHCISPGRRQWKGASQEPSPYDGRGYSLLAPLEAKPAPGEDQKLLISPEMIQSAEAADRALHRRVRTRVRRKLSRISAVDPGRVGGMVLLALYDQTKTAIFDWSSIERHIDAANRGAA